MADRFGLDRTDDEKSAALQHLVELDHADELARARRDREREKTGIDFTHCRAAETPPGYALAAPTRPAPTSSQAPADKAGLDPGHGLRLVGTPTGAGREGPTPSSPRVLSHPDPDLPTAA